MTGERSAPTDAALWERVRGDDAEAFGALFDRHGVRVHGYVLRRTGDVSAAEDVTATVFLEAWRLRHRVELDRPSALPWLFGVAANVTRHWHRARRRHRAALDRLAQRPQPEVIGVERTAEAAEAAARVLAHVRVLPSRERDVLALSVWEGFDHAEIADALGIAVGTVKSRLARARRRLQAAADSRPGTPTICLEEASS
jgi:RNA polymerase sigma-70 factor (ECF subfamily)